MQKKINKLFARLFKVQFIRTHKIKEQPIPLIRPHALRFLHFYDLLRKIENIKGDIIECGVGWGRSLFALSLFASIFEADRHIYGFDSFQGFPQPSSKDDPESSNLKEGRYTTEKEGVIKYLVNSGIEPFFIDRNITLIEGYFSDTLKKFDCKEIALLHLDVDLYSSYKETLEYFYPKVVGGGVIAFDEYQATEKFPGARKAIDEFFFNKKEKLIKSNIIDRYYIIKE